MFLENVSKNDFFYFKQFSVTYAHMSKIQMVCSYVSENQTCKSSEFRQVQISDVYCNMYSAVRKLDYKSGIKTVKNGKSHTSENWTSEIRTQALSKVIFPFEGTNKIFLC